MIKRILVIAAFFLLINVMDTQAASLEKSLSFKVTVVENAVEYEWEYQNPDEFEYEHGNTVVKNGKARLEVMKMFRYLNISPDAKVKEMVSRLKKDGHTAIERLEVRWVNSEEKLYTWVWNKKE